MKHLVYDEGGTEDVENKIEPDAASRDSRLVVGRVCACHS